MCEPQFLPNTIEYFKENNTFIPSKNTRKLLFEQIKPFINNESRILEPFALTGEFVHQLNSMDISFNLTILEENKDLFDHLNNKYNNDNYDIFNDSFLKLSPPHNFRKFNIIIGAPPSKLIDKKTSIGSRFKHWFVDKTDIYSLYFMRAIDLLYNDGIIAFILPDSFLNASYIQMLRNKIVNQGSIIHMQRLSNLFTRTTYNTILVVFQKNIENKNNYTYISNKLPFFDFNPDKYEQLLKNTKFLNKLNCKIRNGFITKHNPNRNNNVQNIPILYNKNIESDNTLKLYKSNKQYISSEYIDFDIIKKPSLIISKFYGNADDEYKINCALCTLEKYVCNDNLFIITFPHLSHENSVMLIYDIIKSFNSPNMKIWKETHLKNGILNKYQIKHYLPLFI